MYLRGNNPFCQQVTAETPVSIFQKHSAWMFYVYLTVFSIKTNVITNALHFHDIVEFQM